MEKNKKNSLLKLFFYKEKIGKFKKNNSFDKLSEENLIGKFFKKKTQDIYCFLFSEEIESFIGNSLNFEDFENEEISFEFPEIYNLQKKFINSFFFSDKNPLNLFEDYVECNKEEGLKIFKNINFYESLIFFVQKNNLIHEFSKTLNFYFSQQDLNEKKTLFLKIFLITNDFNFTKKLCELSIF